jgi:hypothetical protein
VIISARQGISTDNELGRGLGNEETVEGLGDIIPSLSTSPMSVGGELNALLDSTSEAGIESGDARSGGDANGGSQGVRCSLFFFDADFMSDSRTFCAMSYY